MSFGEEDHSEPSLVFREAQCGPFNHLGGSVCVVWILSDLGGRFVRLGHSVAAMAFARGLWIICTHFSSFLLDDDLLRRL